MLDLRNQIMTKTKQINLTRNTNFQIQMGNDLNFDLSLNITVFSCRVQGVQSISSLAERMNDMLTFTASLLPEEHEYI